METQAKIAPQTPGPKRLARSTRIFLFSLLAGFLFFPFTFLCVQIFGPMPHAGDESPYHRILIGHTFDEVAKQLGGGGYHRSRDEFLKGKSSRAEQYEFQSAERSGAVFFVVWQNKQDWNIRYQVGFNADKRVVFKARFLGS